MLPSRFCPNPNENGILMFGIGFAKHVSVAVFVLFDLVGNQAAPKAGGDLLSQPLGGHRGGTRRPRPPVCP
jgi:hypothetical protein